MVTNAPPLRKPRRGRQWNSLETMLRLSLHDPAKSSTMQFYFDLDPNGMLPDL